jgi:hypothetical protein
MVEVSNRRPDLVKWGPAENRTQSARSCSETAIQKNLEGPNADPSEVIHSFFWPCSLAITRYSLWPGIIGAKKLDRSEHPFLVKYSVTKFRGSIQG